MLRISRKIIILNEHTLTILLLLDKLASFARRLIVFSANAEMLDIDVSSFITAIDLMVTVQLLINLVFVVVVVELSLDARHHNVLHVDAILDVTSLPDSLDFCVDERALVLGDLFALFFSTTLM